MKLKLFLPLVLLLAFFTACNDDDDAVEASSNFMVKIENVVTPTAFFQSGVFNTPVDASGPAPLFPGDAYEFSVNAGPHILPGDGGTRISFVAMMVQSNDLFYAPGEEGIALYDESGNAIGSNGAVDVTAQIDLWDAGTEVNEETGGPNQKPQQDPTAEDQGVDENGVVTLITNNMDDAGNILPADEDVIKVTIENTGGTEFLIRIENVSDMNTIMVGGNTAPVPISPGVYAVHTAESPFFKEGQAASDAGLANSDTGVEDIAEDGVTTALASDAEANTGLIVPLSPGVYAVHTGSEVLFSTGSEDFGEGLQGIAEDGTPGELASALSAKSNVFVSGAFDTPDGAGEPGAIGPGGSYSFTIEARPGDYLSLATMFVQSNDWFYSFDENGLLLFDGDVPVTGDVTSSIELYDAGTEVDEVPGAGLNQVIRQSSADSGATDSNNTVRLVSDSGIPSVSSVIKVTVTPQ